MPNSSITSYIPTKACRWLKQVSLYSIQLFVNKVILYKKVRSGFPPLFKDRWRLWLSASMDIYKRNCYRSEQFVHFLLNNCSKSTSRIILIHIIFFVHDYFSPCLVFALFIPIDSSEFKAGLFHHKIDLSLSKNEIKQWKMGNNYLFQKCNFEKLNMIWKYIREQYLYTVIHVHVHRTGTGFN